MSKKRKNVTYEAIWAVSPIVDKDIENKYTGQKKEMAKLAKTYAMEYMFNRPIGMSGLVTQNEIHEEIKSAVIKRFKDEKARQNDSNAPKTFIFGGFLFMAILSGVISWCVGRLLSNIFDD